MKKMGADRYEMKRFSLRFSHRNIEEIYIDEIVDRSLLFCRISWGIVLLFDFVFAPLDQSQFGADADLVLFMRVLLGFIALLVLLATYVTRLRLYLVYSSPLFVFVVGLFCTVQTALQGQEGFTPYFNGLFFAYAGVFTTVGMGFGISLVTLLLNLVLFNLILGVLIPVSTLQLLVYNFFLPGIIVVFSYSCYLIERASRKNFVISVKLKHSMSEIRVLGGLLPICASCKKIRDDTGYWENVESYIAANSEASFSHSLCPECMQLLYPDIVAKQKRRKKSETQAK